MHKAKDKKSIYHNIMPVNLSLEKKIPEFPWVAGEKIFFPGFPDFFQS